MCNPNSVTLSPRRRRQQQATTLSSQSKLRQALFRIHCSMMGQQSIGAPLLSNATVPQEGGAPAPVGEESTTYTVPTRPAPISSKEATNSTYNTVPLVTTLQQLRLPNQEAPPPKKAKRRRKPQKPGKTAKHNDRHFVIHNYHDHADDSDDQETEKEGRRRGGVAVSFPQKLHTVLDQVEADGLAHVLSWQPHGRCFVIHKPKEFTEHVMPHYFRQTKLTSFQRQLNLYGFNRVTRGQDAGGYYHELFLRGKEFLCKRMSRTKVKGTKFKAASSPDQEPNFYAMKPVLVTPHSSDGEQSEGSQGASYFMYSVEGGRSAPATIGSTGRQQQQQQQQQQTSTNGTSEGYQHYQIPIYTAPVASKAPPPKDSSVAYSYSAPAPPATAVAATTAQTTTTTEAARMPTLETQAAALPNASEGVLDQAVEELFLDSTGARVEFNDSVLDFVNVWDPASYGGDAALENDTQLGNLLDKLLVDEF